MLLHTVYLVSGYNICLLLSLSLKNNLIGMKLKELEENPSKRNTLLINTKREYIELYCEKKKKKKTSSLQWKCAVTGAPLGGFFWLRKGVG